ncbi:antibiotic biosynthesis monooxygenase [Actinoplanes sp. LDG1-06]|uniref:Antibiotic biosynthesis monooxygenase n=1 Tax=Paractinoplanes ovalisporus TaxID=2810368 RepID=A0ABS2ALQ9_9ACTN|nr:putative quinol monooxygenase [Actinoplanes ovalisporus]MBM2620775.1 antibiotic biosynthesis monooxygenase [Actinoplanes ovalisporus]
MSDGRPVLPEPDEDETGPYTHLGFARARSGHEDEVERLILALVEPLRAEEGALEFHVHRDRADRSLFVIYEMFRSKPDLEKHLAQQHTRDFVREIAPHVEGPLRQQFLRMSSALPATVR